MFASCLTRELMRASLPTYSNGGNAPVGFAQRLASRLIPTAAFATQASRKQLGLDIIKAMRANVPTVSIQNVLTLIKPVPFQIYMTGVSGSVERFEVLR